MPNNTFGEKAKLSEVYGKSLLKYANEIIPNETLFDKIATECNEDSQLATFIILELACERQENWWTFKPRRLRNLLQKQLIASALINATTDHFVAFVLKMEADADLIVTHMITKTADNELLRKQRLEIFSQIYTTFQAARSNDNELNMIECAIGGYAFNFSNADARRLFDAILVPVFKKCESFLSPYLPRNELPEDVYGSSFVVTLFGTPREVENDGSISQHLLEMSREVSPTR